jgi:hypothetical protein
MKNVSIRKVNLEGKKFVLTYDEYETLDTVVIDGTDTPLASTNKQVKKLVRNADAILNFMDVPGVTHY